MQEHKELNTTFEFYDMSREEIMERSMKQFHYIHSHPEILKHHQSKSFTTLMMDYMQGQFPFGISISMFLMTIQNLGNDEQAETWGALAQQYKIHGCYAQTELGHGSNINGIETTATLDKTTDEFVLNTPSIKAAKFWPGELGRYSNFAAVCARLIIDGEDYGIQFFFVPIRDQATHQPFPGVEVGDLGNKMGYQSKDNGFMLFSNYRIPRKNLLSKFCQVSQDGKITLSGDPRLMYAVMLCMRMWIFCIVWRFSAYATIIAGRYAVIRRQFLTLEKGNKKERKLMDYQAHAVKLVSTLAQSLTFNLAQNHMNEYYMNFI